MKHPLKKFLSTVFIATTLAGCGNDKESSTVITNFAITGSGQPAVAMNNFQKALSLLIPTAVALTPPALVDSTNLPVTLTSSWIVLKKIKFKTSEVAEAGEGSEVKSVYEGPFFIDLLSNAPISFGDIEIPESGLRRVKMLLHKSNGDIPASVSAPAGLNGNSIYLSGTVNGNNFTYQADDTTDFEISGPTAVVPEETKDLLAVIRIGDLFKKIKLSGVTNNTIISSSNRVPTATPCPLIHASASDLYTCFVKGMASEAKFGKDNGDKDLNSNDETVD